MINFPLYHIILIHFSFSIVAVIWFICLQGTVFASNFVKVGCCCVIDNTDNFLSIL